MPSHHAPCRRTVILATFCATLLVTGCAQLPGRTDVALDRAPLAALDRAIQDDIAARKLPGAVFHLERAGAVYEKAFGAHTYEAGAPAVTPATVFDAASLSKVLATAPAVLLLAEEGRLDLEAPLARYFT